MSRRQSAQDIGSVEQKIGSAEGKAPGDAEDTAPDYDVVIVGYGPVGQALAALLGGYGHHVGVLERHEEIYPLPRAVHLDHEIMRLLQALGLAGHLAGELFPIREYHWFGADGEPIFTMHQPTPAPSGWEPDYLFFQPTLEDALDRAARGRETVDVARGWAAEGVEQDATGVELTLRRVQSGQTRPVRARFLLGADGANSIVRESLQVGQLDLGFQEQWLVVDVLPDDIDALSHLPDACQWCDPRRPHMHARNGNRHRRWEFMLLPGETAADFDDTARVWQLLEPFLSPDEGEIIRHAVYEFRSMLAERMRVGRVLLAGDAAHLTPPFMGQGLCAGLRDALNIAWKLDLVLRGLARQELLDSVQPERQAQNEWIINLAVEMGRVSCQLDAHAAAERDASMRAAGELPPLQSPRLTAGVFRRDDDGRPDPLAGELSVQGRVRDAGVEGLFDDVVGRGFMLITADGDPADHLCPEHVALLDALGATVRSLEQIEDLDGRLTGWLAEHGAHAVLVRPDFYVFGSAASPAELPALIDDLRAQLGASEPVRTPKPARAA